MSSIRGVYVGANEVLRSWASNEVVRPLLEPVLHPSAWRIGALGVSTLVGHPLFYWIWTDLLPQPYEDLALRLFMSVLGGALLVLARVTDTPPRSTHATAFTLIFWVNLPFFFSWMYFCNGGNTVWLASLGVMFLIYYHVTDWRLATLGSASGLLLAWLLFDAIGPETVPMGRQQLATNAVVIAFSWVMGLLLGISSSNLRREQLNYTLGTMGIMAHELRTPLATITCAGENLADNVVDSPVEARQYGRIIQQEGRRLNRTIADILLCCRLQVRADAALNLAPTGIDTVIDQAVADSLMVTSAPAGTVERAIEPRLPQVMADGEALRVAIKNLVVNAIRHGQGSPIRVSAQSLRTDGEIVVDVEDEGPGIPEDELPKVFDSFFRGRMARDGQVEGSGIGLSVVYHVVRAHGGQVRASRVQPHGTRFTVILPALGHPAAHRSDTAA